MPAAIPIVVAGSVATGVAATVGTAIAGAAISTAAATAIGAGVIATGASLATGSDVGDALKTGVVSGLTAGIGSTIGSAVAGAGAVSDAAFIAADAAQLAGQGLSEAAITQNLVGAGVSQSAAQTAAQLAVSGAAQSAIESSLGSGTLFDVPRTPAPVDTAKPTPAKELQYPGREVQQTYTPTPGSLQEALPEFGIETQASRAPFTAVPGSFQAATPSLLAPIPSPGLSIKDAFRTARLANSLLGGAEQQPIMPRQDQTQPMQYTGVDALQLTPIVATSPDIAGLLSPQAGESMIPTFGLYSGQPSLLPETKFSLLG